MSHRLNVLYVNGTSAQNQTVDEVCIRLRLQKDLYPDDRVVFVRKAKPAL